MSETHRRTVLKTAGSLAVVGTVAGCAGENDQQPIGQAGNETNQSGNETGQRQQELGGFRVVHASPDAPNVDVYFDDEAAFEDLGFGTASAYSDIQPGTYQVQITAAGDQETVVFEEEVTIEPGQVTTAVVYGEAAGGPETALDVQLLEDDLTDPGEEMARLRLFHAVPDAPPITVMVAEGPEGTMGGGNQTQNESQNQTGQQPAGGQPLVQALAFGEYETVTVPAGDYTFDIVPATQGQQPAGVGNETSQNQTTGNETTDNQTVDNETQNQTTGNESAQGGEPVATFDATLESGGVYSAFAIGYLNPEAVDSDAAFEVLLLEDAMGGERSDGGSEQGLFGLLN